MQQEMDFGVFATAAANHARRRNSPPVPDTDGLFDAEGVAVICGRRQCHFEVAGELFGTVQFRETRVPLTAIAPGKWDPIAILSACTRAHGGKVFEVDYATAKPTNPGGLDELRIAAVLGADGLRPYLSKTARYFEGDHGLWAPVRNPAETELVSFRRATAGKPTWAFKCVINMPDDGVPKAGGYSLRRALRALEDAGLMSIQLGPRGGMATARCTWTARAFLAPERLAPADEEAMELLA